MDGGSDIIKLGAFGSLERGKSWDGKGHSNIVQIFISHDDGINSIQYQYVEDGKLMLSELHGKLYKRKFDVVEINYPKEFITRIKGCTTLDPYDYEPVLSSITFGTNLGEYGPFGATTAKEFSVKLGEVNRQFFGFYGSASDTVKSIGVYLKPNMTLDLEKKERIN